MSEKPRFFWSKISLLFLAIIYVWTFFNVHRYTKNGVISHDVVEYYSYLPALFIYGDISMKFADSDPEFFGDKIWGSQTGDGTRIPKYTMGTAISYLPFFLGGHAWASVSDTYEADGYTQPYRFALMFAGLFYALIGLLFLRKILIRKWSEKVVAITLICIGLGTNLYHYATNEAPMPHAALFALITIFLWLSRKFIRHPSFKWAILMGLSGGLAMLMRPTHIVIWFFPLLYGIYKKEHINARLRFIRDQALPIAGMIFAAFLVGLPQLIHWKVLSGNWIFYSYADEGFFFLNPQFGEVLFGFRKGFLIYTPVMVLALVGVWFLRKDAKSWFWPVLTVFVLATYLLSSWWCWWYGGSFGMRPYIDYYGLLGVPLCVFFYRFGRKFPKGKVLRYALAFVFVALAMVQTYQYKAQVIHWDSMTAQSYFRNFFKLKRPPDAAQYLDPPDYEAAKRGRR